jgi:hypothetical protein
MGRGRGRSPSCPPRRAVFADIRPSMIDRDGLCAVPLLHGADGADAQGIANMAPFIATMVD